MFVLQVFGRKPKYWTYKYDDDGDDDGFRVYVQPGPKWRTDQPMVPFLESRH